MKIEGRAAEYGRYLLTSFQQRDNVRQYWFNARTEAGEKRDFVVDVDLALILRYGIPVQEIPLLCRRVLEEKPVSQQKCRLTLTEAQMEAVADRAAELKTQAEHRRNWSFKPRPADRAP